MSQSRASWKLFSNASRSEWGQLDILVHSIAFAPKEDLQGGLLDCSSKGFSVAMDISCHSFIRMAALAAPLMKDGGTMFAMSYHGAQKVVPNYNVMGPVKAALEAACRYLAYELGPQKIRVHAISPGPLKTRAASGLKDFDRDAERGGGTLSDRRVGGHHGCRIFLRLPGYPVWTPTHRADRVCGWGREHHGMNVRASTSAGLHAALRVMNRRIRWKTKTFNPLDGTKGVDGIPRRRRPTHHPFLGRDAAAGQSVPGAHGHESPPRAAFQQ